MDDLQQLLHVLRLEQARERGELSDAEYYGALPPRIITSQNATGILVVPQPIPAEVWEAVEDETTIAQNRAALEAWAEKTGVNRKPEPDPAPKPGPASRSLRHAPDKNPQPKFKSLAKRFLRR